MRVSSRFNTENMGCEICGRSSCTKSFHSLDEQDNFDNVADEIKERAKRIISNKVNHLTGNYDENDVYWVRLDEVISAIEDYS